MASAPEAAPQPGTLQSRLASDDTFYKTAPLDEKVSIEKALAQEMMQTHFPSDGLRVVPKGPLPPAALAAAVPAGVTLAKQEHTAVWHVLFPGDDEMVKIVFVYAHVEGEKGMNWLLGVLRKEFEGLEREGRLLERRAFGIVQGGTKIGFLEFDGRLGGR